MNQDRLELLATYKANDIQYLLTQRKSDVIPQAMWSYIFQLDCMARLFH